MERAVPTFRVCPGSLTSTELPAWSSAEMFGSPMLKPQASPMQCSPGRARAWPLLACSAGGGCLQSCALLQQGGVFRRHAHSAASLLGPAEEKLTLHVPFGAKTGAAGYGSVQYSRPIRPGALVPRGRDMYRMLARALSEPLAAKQLEPSDVAGRNRGVLPAGIARSRRGFRPVSEDMAGEIYESLGAEVKKKISSVRGVDQALDVIRFLLQFWVSKKTLVKAVKEHPELLTADMRQLEQKTAFFTDRRSSPGEIGSAITRMPSLLLKPMETFERVVSYLMENGVESERAGRVILLNPGILDVELDARTDELIGSLQEVCGAPVEGIIERKPKLLELTGADVRARIDIMISFGMTEENISNLVISKPGVLLLPPSVLLARFENLSHIFSHRRLPNIFKVTPLLILISPERINQQYEVLVEQLGEEVADKVVNAFPQALHLRWEKVLLPKLEYLQELGLHTSEVVNFPAYLGYSLGDRIRPRCEKLLEAGYTIASHADVISIDSESRQRRYRKSHRENLELNGTHSVAIQHIVGLKDEEFEAQFGVKLDRVAFTPYGGAQEGMDDVEVDDIDDLSDEGAGEQL